MAKVSRVYITPERLMANDDRGYQITASLDGTTLHIAAECVVVSDSSHVSPRYDGYVVSPRVYDDDRVPTLAEIVAEACGWWAPDDVPPSRLPRAARQWLAAHPTRVMGFCAGEELDN